MVKTERKEVAMLLWSIQLALSATACLILSIFAAFNDDARVPFNTHVLMMAVQIALRSVAIRIPQEYKGRTTVNVAVDAGASIVTLLVWEDGERKACLRESMSHSYPLPYGMLYLSVALAFVTDGLALRVLDFIDNSTCPSPWLRKHFVLEEEEAKV